MGAGAVSDDGRGLVRSSFGDVFEERHLVHAEVHGTGQVSGLVIFRRGDIDEDGRLRAV